VDVKLHPETNEHISLHEKLTQPTRPAHVPHSTRRSTQQSCYLVTHGMQQFTASHFPPPNASSK